MTNVMICQAAGLRSRGGGTRGGREDQGAKSQTGVSGRERGEQKSWKAVVAGGKAGKGGFRRNRAEEDAASPRPCQVQMH